MDIKKRNETICNMYKKGYTMNKIAIEFGITNARVSQILRSRCVKIKRRSEYKNTYFEKEDCVEITLSNKEKVLIDKQDLPKVSLYSWCVGCNNRIVANVNGKVVYLHRYIIGNVDGIIDHINGNNRDNRRCNLRITNAKGNARNNISKNKYGVNGIRKTPQGKYQARITVNYKYVHIGTYETIEQAKKARIDAEQKYFGEYAPTNRY